LWQGTMYICYINYIAMKNSLFTTLLFSLLFSVNIFSQQWVTSADISFKSGNCGKIDTAIWPGDYHNIKFDTAAGIMSCDVYHTAPWSFVNWTVSNFVWKSKYVEIKIRQNGSVPSIDAGWFFVFDTSKSFSFSPQCNFWFSKTNEWTVLWLNLDSAKKASGASDSMTVAVAIKFPDGNFSIDYIRLGDAAMPSAPHIDQMNDYTVQGDSIQQLDLTNVTISDRPSSLLQISVSAKKGSVIKDLKLVDSGDGKYIDEVSHKARIQFNPVAGVTNAWDSIIVNIAAPFFGTHTRMAFKVNVLTPSICIVTIDSATNKNLLIIKRGVKVKKYRIYKEANFSNQYDLIDSIDYDKENYFLDSASNPRVRSNRYRITVVDTAGIESPSSVIHKTLHLNLNMGLGGGVNLIWENYEGIPVSKYTIMQGDTANVLYPLTDVPSNITTYTVYENPKKYYQLNVSLSDACDVTSIIKSGKSYGQIKSNVAKYDINNIGGNMMGNVEVYPNPFDDELKIHYNVAKDADVEIILSDALGRIVAVRKLQNQQAGNLDYMISGKDLNLSSGVYFIKIIAGNDTHTQKCLFKP
jgi:hypothetical protein